MVDTGQKLPPPGMWDLLIRNVTRDAVPLTSAQLEQLRQTRTELGATRWKQLLDVARDEAKRRKRHSQTPPSAKPSTPPRSRTPKPPQRRTLTPSEQPPPAPAVVVREQRVASPSAGAAARAGVAATCASAPTSPTAVAAASARKRQLADARAVAACASAARKRAIQDARESRRALQVLETALEKRDAELREARAVAKAAAAERDALRERVNASNAGAALHEYAGAALRRLDSARGAALLAAAVVVDSAMTEGCPAPAKLALAAAEDHLRAFASAALTVSEKFGAGAAPPTRAAASVGATDAAADAQHFAELAAHLDRESASVPAVGARTWAAPTPTREGPKGAWR